MQTAAAEALHLLSSLAGAAVEIALSIKTLPEHKITLTCWAVKKTFD